jgi:carboxyl-terminal processing protease
LKKSYYLAPVVLAFVLALGIFIGGKLGRYGVAGENMGYNSKKAKLNRLIDFIDNEYVEEINTDSIVEVTVNNILEKLDPHSVYIPQSAMQRVTENMKGDFVGIGVSFFRNKDTISITRTIEGGPSARAGLLAGDKILIANNDTLYGKNLTDQDIVTRLKGEVGSPVRLKIFRKSEQRTFEVTIKRDLVPIRSVDAAFMLTTNMGYLRINRFAESTNTEFEESLKQLLRSGANRLVLDLRDNPGGYLAMAEQISDAFLPKGKLIVFTKNKKGQTDSVFATSKGSMENKPVYVLINENSASASEVIAGALQDNDLGTIVGRRSFGKGLVQREMDLGDGSAVRLTIARYFTPTGRSIQKSYKKGAQDYYETFIGRYYSGELESADSIKVEDSLRFVTPAGKVVYGGGGIIPDVFVPIGTHEAEAIAALDERGFFSRFAFEHLEDYREDFSKYDAETYLNAYQADDILFERFQDFLILYGFEMDLYPHEGLIKTYLKAALAEQLFSMDIKLKILTSIDSVIQKVLELDALKQ